MNRPDLPRSIARCLVVCGLLVAGAARAQSGGLDDRIAALEAREAIRELIYAYGRALDTRDFVAFSALFAPQRGTWDGGFGSATGREAIFELMDESIGHADQPVAPRSHHVFTNIQIEVDGDAATATTKWIFVVPSESGEPRWMYLGHYDDRFVREDGQWYFLLRRASTDIPVEQQGASE
jgi:3-phenylpropionate/cinnamic acid dioxygenase small subunit